MSTQIQRIRHRPTWRGGLRIGRERDTMMAYMAAHPVLVEDMRRIHRQLDAWGVVPMSMEGVRQPFDHVPRRTVNL